MKKKCVCGYEGEYGLLKLLSVETWKDKNGDEQVSDAVPIKVKVCQGCGMLKIEEEEDE